MSGRRQAYVVIGANVSALPAIFPGWLLEIIDAMAAARDAVINVESAVAVVAQASDEEKSKAARCHHLLETFIRDHGHRMHEAAQVFASKKNMLPEGVAISFGADLGVLLITCGNIAFRAHVLNQVIGQWPEDMSKSGTAATLALTHCMAQSSIGQGTLLDWIGAKLVGQSEPGIEPDA